MNSASLEAIEQIRQLKARYFRLLDGKQWPLYAELFTTDATADGREGFAARDDETGNWTVNGAPDMVTAHLAGLDVDSMVVSGALAIAAKAQALFPPPVVTVHHGHMAEITIDSDTSGHGIWAMEDRILYPQGYPLTELHGFGHYHETYRRDGGAWRIASFRLTRLRVDIR